MNKINTLLMTAVVIFSSCQKNDQYLADDAVSGHLQSANLDKKPNAEVKGCPIIQITYPVGSGSDIMKFSYNAAGDPVSATRANGAYTGYPNYVFKYDGKSRLTEFIGTYSNNSAAEFWHKYFYDGKGNIVRDSAYIFPTITNGYPQNAYSRQLTYYTYDSKRRIIKDSTVFEGNVSAVVHSYTYDGNGNRVGGSYDDKVNINRTNTVWMFLNRDYSVNNPFNATMYNGTGLPSSFDLPSEGKGFGFLGNGFYKAQIIYGCDAATMKG